MEGGGWGRRTRRFLPVPEESDTRYSGASDTVHTSLGEQGENRRVLSDRSEDKRRTTSCVVVHGEDVRESYTS